MTKEELEKKKEELASKWMQSADPVHNASSDNHFKESFKDGFDSAVALLLPRLEEAENVVKALQDAENELRWHAEKWHEEGFGNIKKGRAGNAYQGAENASKVIKEYLEKKND